MPGMWRAETMAWPMVTPSITMALMMSLLMTSLLSGMGGALLVTRALYVPLFKLF